MTGLAVWEEKKHTPNATGTGTASPTPTPLVIPPHELSQNTLLSGFCC